MKIEVKEHNTRYHVCIDKKIDNILTGKYHYKLIIIDMDDIPF
jgi:hypothetical protein